MKNIRTPILQGVGSSKIASTKRGTEIKKQAFGYSSSASNNVVYRNSFDCIVKVVKDEGVKGLFRGLTASYLGAIEASMQWIMYEQLKQASHRLRGNDDGPRHASQLVDNLFMAGFAKFFASVVTYPHEVLRTRMRQIVRVEDPTTKALITRSRYGGMGDVFRTVLREEGAMAFYGGLGAHLLRTVPNAAIMFFCYESVVFLFGNDGNNSISDRPVNDRK